MNYLFPQRLIVLPESFPPFKKGGEGGLNSELKIPLSPPLIKGGGDRAFFIIAILLFIGSAAATIMVCSSMSAMSGMPMPGGWTMSMTWMRMPRQSWTAAAAMFLGMWTVMMVAMMLPSLMPMLLRYRQALKRKNTAQLGKLTACAGIGYFFVWTLLGIAIFPLGVLFANIEMQISILARIVPLAVGIIVALAGAFQFSVRKNHYLACCNEIPRENAILSPNIVAAWRHGLHLGLHCIYCCANLMSILLVVGVMDSSAMFIVTLAISAERLAPNHRIAARGFGVIGIVGGVCMVANAALRLF